MTNDRESSKSIFSYLTGQVRTSSKLTVRNSDVLTEYGPVVHAIDGNGYPTLLVPVKLQPENSIDWQNKLVTFGYRTIIVGGKPQAFLALQCHSERVRSQFSLLADDIMTAVEGDSTRADLLTRQTVDRWKELLRDDKQRLLSQPQLAGLFGELCFLEQLSFHHGSWALRSWTGPQGNRHDFEFGNASFEVKTTVSNNNMIVRFHGVRQLEETNGQPLYVAAFQTENTPQGESIPTVLERLYDSGINRLDMLRLLEKIGYFEADAGLYAAHRFLVLDAKTLAVGTDFPRITRETMPMPGMLDGISDLQYAVDLGPLPAVEVHLEGLREAVAW